jgi:hypothetical protein
VKGVRVMKLASKVCVKGGINVSREVMIGVHLKPMTASKMSEDECTMQEG